MRPLYIFDLDGTLALTEHRAHFLRDRSDPDRWRKFYAACVRDQPNRPVIGTFQLLRTFADVWVWSGRSREVERETMEWLHHYLWVTPLWMGTCLQMRDARDHTDDAELKQRWLMNLLDDDRQRLVAVFDDRRKVVDMWRRNGVACFQVAPGEF